MIFICSCWLDWRTGRDENPHPVSRIGSYPDSVVSRFRHESV